VVEKSKSKDDQDYGDEYDDEYYNEGEYGEEEQKELDHEYGEEEQEDEQYTAAIPPKPCMSHLLGKCKIPQCRDLHVEVPHIPLSMCKHFLMDKCTFGQQCKNKHDETFKINWLPKLAEAIMLAMQQQEVKNKYKSQKHASLDSIKDKNKGKNLNLLVEKINTEKNFDDVPPPPKFIGQPKAMPLPLA
jgi:hypothetical protein